MESRGNCLMCLRPRRCDIVDKIFNTPDCGKSDRVRKSVQINCIKTIFIIFFFFEFEIMENLGKKDYFQFFFFVRK